MRRSSNGRALWFAMPRGLGFSATTERIAPHVPNPILIPMESMIMEPLPHAAEAGATGPLAGIRVLDLSAYIAGPYGCTLLADQGAEVIKIEPPTGDNLRKYPSTLEAESRAFLGVNRGKRGLVLDLKLPEALDVLMHLVKTADVLVHNFRPSVPARLGIAYEQLRDVNPRLIYCAVTGYGETGPNKDKAGYDQVLQTMSGMCTLQGKRGGPPEILYGSVVDYYAAALVAAGVSSALFERERNGAGQYVGVSLLRSALTMQSARMIWADSEPKEVGRDMRSGGITGIHPTREGYLYISANTPHFWQALCEKTGLGALASDERYDSVRKRALHCDEIVPRLHEALATRSALEWEALFGDAVPCAAARSIEDMFDDPQVLAEDMVATYDYPGVGRYRGFRQPIRFGDTSGPAPLAAPAFGQHSDAVLRDAGLSDDEIADLRAKRAVL
jgi:crotonobetainyl-CoA:carnitine CoA-transferase CaiB-like acyl-CoA transferase